MDDFDKLINSLNKLSEELSSPSGATADCVQNAAKRAVTEIKANSPVGYTGKYKDGWTWAMRDDLVAIVYNDGKHKSLSHLLEFPHLDKSGKTVPPQPHISTAYDKVKVEYVESLKRINITHF